MCKDISKLVWHWDTRASNQVKREQKEKKRHDGLTINKRYSYLSIGEDMVCDGEQCWNRMK